MAGRLDDYWCAGAFMSGLPVVTGSATVGLSMSHVSGGCVSVPDLLTAKISYGFDHLDADGDGQLTEDDHVLMGQRVAASLGHASGSPAEQQIIDAYLR